jgi:hypothetical protein
MTDRVLLGKNEAGDQGLWVSKPGVDVTPLAGNTYLQSLSRWYGYQEEFDGNGTDGVFSTIESFSGLYTSSEIRGVIRTTANGTVIYTGNAGDIAFHTKINFSGGSVNAKPNSGEVFIGSEYPIVEMRVRMIHDPGIVDDMNGQSHVLYFVNADLNGTNALGISGSRLKALPNQFGNPPEVGVWKILEWDMSDLIGWMDPHLENGSVGSYSSAFRISQLRFDLTNLTAIPGWNSTANPMWEIDYIRVKKAGVPAYAGRHGSVQDSLLFDSNINHMGLVHQTGIVTIGTAKAYIDGNTSNRVVGHNIDNDADGYVSFPALDYIPLVLYQRLDENYLTTGSSFLSGENEFSVCDIKWEDNRYPTIDMNTSEPSWKGYDIKMVNYGSRNGSGKLLNEPLSSISSLAYYHNNTSNPIHAKENFYVSTSHPPSGLPTNPATGAGSNWNAPFNTGTGSLFWDTHYNSSVSTDRPEVEDWRGFGGIWDSFKNFREESIIRRGSFAPRFTYTNYGVTVEDLEPDLNSYNTIYALDDPLLSGLDIYHITSYADAGRENFLDKDGAPYKKSRPLSSRGRPTLPDFAGTIPFFSERSEITNTDNTELLGHRKWSDLKSVFYETRTFAYVRAKKDGFWLTCRNAIAQEGMEPALNLTPIFPEESAADRGSLAFTNMVSNNDNGAWGMFHPALALYDGTKFTEGLQLKWDTRTTANLALLDKVGVDDIGTSYDQYKWWPNFSCSGVIFDGDRAYDPLKRVTVDVNSLSLAPAAASGEVGGDPAGNLNGDISHYTQYGGYRPGKRFPDATPSLETYKESYELAPSAAATGGSPKIYDAQYTADGILAGIYSTTPEFYPYRTQSNPVYHQHFNAAGTDAIVWPSVGSIDLQSYDGVSDPTVSSPTRRWADDDPYTNWNSGMWHNPTESVVTTDDTRMITQYNYKRISSKGIKHPVGIVPNTHDSADNKNSWSILQAAADTTLDSSAIYNQTSYLGGAMNTKAGGPVASYDSTKTHAPKYRYWVLRIPVSIPEYTL